MKKLTSLILAAIMTASVFAGCTSQPSTTLNATSSSAQYLTDRLGESADGIVLGTDDTAAAYGVDMADFRDEGYVIRKDGADTVIFGKAEDGLDRGVRYYVNNLADADTAYYAYGEGYRVKKIEIGGVDIREFDIYLFEGADACHTTAAEELQKYIELACGVHLDIVRTPAEHMIAYEQVMPEDDRFAVLGDDGFNISVKDDGNLYIAGGRWRGCLNGTYEFLEKYIGWRFAVNYEVNRAAITDDDYYLYESELISLPVGLEDEQVPSFPYRQGRYQGSAYSNIALKQKENDVIRGKAEYNGYGYGRGANHGLLSGPIKNGYFNGLVDPEVIQGIVQPCFTDEDIIAASIEYYTKYIEDRLAAGMQIGRELVEIDIAQNDTTVFCTCQDCREWAKIDGSATGPMLYFANTLAKHFGEKYPGLYVNVLVYLGTTKPPKTTKPLENVSCSYCFYIDTTKVYCANHPLHGRDCIGDNKNNIQNTEYAEQLEKWCELATRVTVWIYPGNWYYNQIPTNVLDTLLDDFRYFKELGLHGVYPCMISQASWDSQDYLITYMLSELAWNADMTEEEYWALIEEYMTIFYGEGAVYLMEYLDWLESTEKDDCFTLQGYSLPQDRQDLIQVKDNYEYCKYLFESAKALAGSAEQEKAVTYFSRPMYFAWLNAAYIDMYENGTDEEKAYYTAEYEAFKELALSTGFAVHSRTVTEDDFDITKHPGSMHHPAMGTVEEWWLK